MPNYSNFKDPVGLVLRMLGSGDRAARSALWQSGLRLLAMPVDWMMRPFECRAVRGAASSELPILLIVGAPRSGTTLVYQTLTRVLDASFFPNVSAIFPGTPITATRWFYRDRSKSSVSKEDFHSFYGQQAGLFAPNDGFHIWNRWLGESRYETTGPLSAAAAAEMATFFDAWQTVFKKPLVNKNNRNAICFDTLAAALPRALVIHVVRDPVFVVQSLIVARERVQGDKKHGWGLCSRDSNVRSESLDYVDAACGQLETILDQIEVQRRALPNARFLQIEYEEFCAKPNALFERLEEKLPGRLICNNEIMDELPPFRSTNRIMLGAEIVDRIRDRFASRAAAER